MQVKCVGRVGDWVVGLGRGILGKRFVDHGLGKVDGVNVVSLEGAGTGEEGGEPSIRQSPDEDFDSWASHGQCLC
jgi:hypothetical protein